MSPARTRYLSVADIVALHERAIVLYGGLRGVRDRGALESCVAQPKTAVFGHERFAELYEKASAYCFFVVRNHPFNDGNKRTGFLAALHFLLINGIVPRFDDDEAFEIISSVAAGTSDIEALTAFFRKAVQ